MTTTETLLSSPEFCQAAGVTYRQICYWVATGELVPAIRGIGSGSRHRAYRWARCRGDSSPRLRQPAHGVR